MVVRAKRQMITRAKTRGELAIQRTRMERLQKERVSVEFEDVEVMETRSSVASRGRPLRIDQRKQSTQKITKAQILGSSLVLSLQAKRSGPTTVDIYVHFPSEWYAIMDVPISIFEGWEVGAATARTDDIRRYKTGKKKGTFKKKRWWRGKHPSQGAFYNQMIKGKYPTIPITGPPAAGSMEVFDDDFDIYGEKVGEPITNG